MTDQIAPSLAGELEQAAKRLSPECEYSGESVYLVALLTRAAALARAAEKLDCWQCGNKGRIVDVTTIWNKRVKQIPCPSCAELRALVSSEGKGE